MNVQEIVREYLKKNEFDGLYNSWECACGIDDLMPCDEVMPDCMPGYKQVMTESESSEFDFIIGPEKPTKE